MVLMADVDHIAFHELGEPDAVLTVGDTVWDSLTMTEARVIGIEVHDGQTPGIWLNNEHVGGGRHPWEISLTKRAREGVSE